MNKSILNFSALMLFLSWAATIPAQTESGKRQYNLRYDLKRGRQFSLLNMHIGNNYNKEGESVDKFSSATRTLELNFETIAVSDTGMTFEVEYKKKLYHNTGKEGETVITDFAPILGRKIRYSISHTGQVGGFTGFKEMPGVQMPGGWVYTGAHLQEEIEHLFPTLPDRPVCLGDTWTRKAFGVNIEYRLMDEVKLYGYDCVRIFAKIWDAQSKTRRKDQSGNEITVERGQPYSDIYYIAYKEGMMLYRFSVSSYGWYKIFNANNEIVNDRIMDSLYETFISFQ